MKTVVAAFGLLVAVASLQAQGPPPIIDVHVHASRLADFEPLVGPAPMPHCIPMTDYPPPEGGRRWPEVLRSRDLPCHATWSPSTDDELMEKSLAIMKRRNMFGIASGPAVDRWKAAAPDRIIPSLGFDGGPKEPSVDTMRAWFAEGRYAVLGEVGAQYNGVPPDDPSLEPYWAMAEKLDIPAGIHIGTGPVGAPYIAFERYRARLHSPLVLEEVLIRHPDLRVYIMHAGWPMLDDLLAVLWTHPHVYIDLGAISWALPRAEFHRYLQRVVEAGFGRRVLFGSDQMVWPETIEMAIQSVEAAGFLTDEQKRDIFFNNAARFLKLTPGRIAAMHGKR